MTYGESDPKRESRKYCNRVRVLVVRCKWTMSTTSGTCLNRIEHEKQVYWRYRIVAVRVCLDATQVEDAWLG